MSESQELIPSGESLPNGGKKKIKVFISYNSKERPLVEELRSRLNKEPDIVMFFDRYSCIHGKDWLIQLENAIDACDVGVWCFGIHGESTWHGKERQGFHEREAAEGQSSFRFIPVVLPGGKRESLRTFTKLLHLIEFHSSIDNEKDISSLLSSIRGESSDWSDFQAVELGQCPYRGLQFFDVEHADSFFGRESATKDLIYNLRETHDDCRQLPRFLAILGSSGSGKSSLAHAGLYAALQRGAIKGSRDWLFLQPLRPGPKPLKKLELALLDAAADSPQLENVRKELQLLAGKPERLHCVARLLVPEASPPRRMFVLIDQFEEVFTSCANEEQRNQFIAELLHAACELGGPVVVVLAMRADYFPKLIFYKAFACLLNQSHQHQYYVGPMNDDELRHAIEEPARSAGATFEPGLVDILINDVPRKASALPLLQYALQELWIHCKGKLLTREAYKAIGTLGGALIKRADAIYNGLDTDEERELYRIIFLQLVRLAEEVEDVKDITEVEDSKRRVKLRELLELGDGDRIWKLIEKLASQDVRLVMVDNGRTWKDDSYVEIAHEALIGSWRRLHDWLVQSRAALLVLRSLARAAAEWEKQHLPEDLWSGHKLANARELIKNNKNKLDKKGKVFLDASSKHEQDRKDEEERRKTELADAERRLEKQKADALLRLEKQKADAAKDQEREAKRSAKIYKIFLQAIAVLLFFTLAAFLLAMANRSLARSHLREQARRSVGNGWTKLKMDVPDFATASLWFADALKLERQGGGDERLHRARLGLILDQTPALFPLLFGNAPVSKVVLSLDGTRLLAVCKTQAILWDMQSRTQLHRFLHAAAATGSEVIHDAAFSPDGRLVATAGEDGTVRVWDAATGMSRLALANLGPVLHAVFNPDNRTLLAAGITNVIVWESRTGTRLFGFAIDDTNKIQSCSFNPKGDRFVTSAGKIAIVSDAATGRDIMRLTNGSIINEAIFSPSGNLVFTAMNGKGSEIWDWRKGAMAIPEGPTIESAEIFHVADGGATLQFASLRKEYVDAHSCAFSPGTNGSYVVVSQSDNRAALLDLRTGKKRFLAHDKPVSHASLSGDGTRVVTASEDETARLWDTATGVLLAVMPHSGPVKRAVFTTDSKQIVTACEDGGVRLWDVVKRRVLPHDGRVLSARFNGNASNVVTTCDDDEARIWDVGAGGLLASFEQTEITNAFFLTNNHQIVAEIHENGAVVWDWRSGKRSTADVPKNNRASGLLSQNGSRLLSPFGHLAINWSVDAKAQTRHDASLADAHTGECLFPLSSDNVLVSANSFGGDDHWMATGGDDGIVRLWHNVPSPAPIESLICYTELLTSRAIGTNGAVAPLAADELDRRWNHLKNSGKEIQDTIFGERTIETSGHAPRSR